MNENIDLTEILKNCQEGTELYHAVYGRVWFYRIDLNLSYPIRLSLSKKLFNNTGVTSKGSLDKDYNGECLLFPSKDQRDWSKFTTHWYKKDKFDPKTLQPFDKVLARNRSTEDWCCHFFSHCRDIDSRFKYVQIDACAYIYCIPYNDDTKHLVGTKEEAPEYYRYWEWRIEI